MSEASSPSSFSLVDPHQSSEERQVPSETSATPAMDKKTKVGAVQAEPAWLDLQGSVTKTIALIEGAGKNGTNILGFPEVFIPGYLWSIWTESVFVNVLFIHEYMANSLVKESPEMDCIRATVKKAGIFVVLGYSEGAAGSLYIAQSFIDQTGTIALHRPKIKPTHVERSIWGDGQADCLTCAYPSTFGKSASRMITILSKYLSRDTFLSCSFETILFFLTSRNSKPRNRITDYMSVGGSSSQGVGIHVAGWPWFWDKPEGMPWPHHVTAEAEKSSCQFIAMERACFVLVCTQILTEKSREKIKLMDSPFAKAPGGGFAMMFGPDGAPLVEPLDLDKEDILHAEIELSAIDFAKQMIDVVGHYSRPDLLSLKVNPEVAKHVHLTQRRIRANACVYGGV